MPTHACALTGAPVANYFVTADKIACGCQQFFCRQRLPIFSSVTDRLRGSGTMFGSFYRAPSHQPGLSGRRLKAYSSLRCLFSSRIVVIIANCIPNVNIYFSDMDKICGHLQNVFGRCPFFLTIYSKPALCSHRNHPEAPAWYRSSAPHTRR